MPVQPRSLSQVIGFIKNLIDTQLANKKFWLKVEISNINFHNSGHCYIEFVENKDGKTIAQCRANIWSSNIQSIYSDLGTDFSNILKKGGEILCQVEVNFNETYGLALNVFHVDRYYALGELERKKQETLNRLLEQQLTEKNKDHALPIVIQKIAVIGSPSTSGHTDFLKQLEKNEYGYRFAIQNYPCQVQGDRAEKEILLRLDELLNSAVDIIVLIRGGGSKLDLEVFNSYEIAKKIALHTKPILTGIGHETDISIADLVANKHFKTPSALGAFVVSRNHHFEISVQNTHQAVFTFYESYMQRQHHRIKQCVTEFRSRAISFTQLRRGSLHTIGNRIAAIVRDKLARQKQFQQLLRQTIQSTIHNSMTRKQNRLAEVSNLISLQSKQNLKRKSDTLSHQRELIQLFVKGKLAKENDFLLHSGEIVGLYHPDNTLERGFSIARMNGTIIDTATEVHKGAEIEVELIDKKIRASVISIQSKKSKWKTLLTRVLPKN